MRNFQDRLFWLSIVLFVVAGLLSGIFAIDAQTYYRELVLPVFSPPGFLFGPVWFVLYILIGVSHYYVLQWKKSSTKKLTLVLFYTQFGLNIIWSFIFFTLKNSGFAAIEIIILWFLLCILQILFLMYDKKVFGLMLPYFLWVSFASVLNIAIYLAN